jgi:hypothetical protein
MTIRDSGGILTNTLEQLVTLRLAWGWVYVLWKLITELQRLGAARSKVVADPVPPVCSVGVLRDGRT